MSLKLKIAIYSGEIPSTTFIERLIVGLSATKHTVYLFGSLSKKVSYNPSVMVVDYTNTRFRKFLHLMKYSLLLTLFHPKDKKKLDQILQKRSNNLLYSKVKSYPVLWHRPDIFHLQWAKGLEDWAWVQEFGMKLVLSLRGAHINYSPISDSGLAMMYRKHFPNVDAFHAVSEAIGIEATKYGAPIEHIKVVKSGLSMAVFPFEIKTVYPKETLTILSVGRDHWKKNYRLGLDVMSELKKKSISFHYTIIGINGNEALLFQRAQLGLEQDVSFINSLPFEYVKRAIDEADVLLLPSLEEGIANVVLEAMALGTLVISSDCGGMSEVVIPGQTGFLVPFRDVEAMAEAVQEVSELSLEAYQTIAINARAFIEKYHTMEGMIADMVSLYNDLKVEKL